MRLRDPDQDAHMACIWVVWAQSSFGFAQDRLEPLAFGRLDQMGVYLRSVGSMS